VPILRCIPLSIKKEHPVANQTHKPQKFHQMHYNADVKGVWSGSGRDLKAECGQSEHIMVTNVREAVDCQKCLSRMER
jgi:hypothetical protein